jgi:hypothetical protein
LGNSCGLVVLQQDIRLQVVKKHKIIIIKIKEKAWNKSGKGNLCPFVIYAFQTIDKGLKLLESFGLD